MVPLGTIVRMGMRIDGVYFSFDTDVIEHVFHPQPTLGVSLPEVMTRRDQRKYYRLPLVMQPDVITLVDDDGKSASRVHGTIVNVSGGGLGLVSPEPVRPGVLLAIQFGLEDQKYASVAQVVSVEEPEEGRFNHRAHLQFLNMSRHDREEIVRYVFRRQITQFRQGLHEEVAG